MNTLPVGLEEIADPKLRSDYFKDLEKRGFDVAFSTFCADVYYSAAERFRQAYTEFAAEAHRLGYPVCIRIPTSIAGTARLGLEEAQYGKDNKPLTSGADAFVASPASDSWRRQIEELIVLFVRDLGHDWIAIEEPAYMVDVPGTKDRLSEKFAQRFPDARYPSSSDESPEYLMVQQAKADVVAEFCLGLAASAREAGAAKVGLVPQILLPAAQGKAGNIPRTACDPEQLIQADEVDFLISDIAPGKVYSGAVTPGKEAVRTPVACYVEVKAHSAGKPVLTVASPVWNGGAELVPADFQRDAILSVLAAGSSGFSGQDCGSKPVEDEAIISLLAEAGSYAGRLGQGYSPVAFVFSESGCRHAPPNDYGTVFRHYWAFANGVAARSHLPFLTFRAGSLQQSLAAHPEVRVLVFEEHYPLTVDQMIVIRDWWQGPEKRAIVAFASGLGLSADPEFPGSRPCVRSLPGVLELIGLKQDLDQPVFEFDKPVSLTDVSRVRRSAFLQDKPDLRVKKVANVRRVFGSRASVLYEADIEDPKIPVVAEWKDRTTLAIFCGFGLDTDTAEAAELAVRYALKETDSSIDIVSDCSDGVLWSINKNGYIVMSNISDKKATAVGKPGRNTFWDCKAQKMIADGDAKFSIDPHSFAVYRVVGRRSKFFDIKGVSDLKSLMDGAGRAEIEILAGKTTTLVLRASPKEISVDGKASTISQQVINGAYHVTLQQCPPGERRIGLKW